MASKRAIVTVGLGFGDECKGATVDYLCRNVSDVNLVVRYCGGSQAGHNVQLPNGHRHTFAQFGSGTFVGVKTYLGRHMIINPYALTREAKALESVINNPLSMLIMHPKTLVSTIYHRYLNQLKETARDGNRHGSCGHGIGETRSYWLDYGDDAIFVEDLINKRRLRDKIELLRQRIDIEAQKWTEHLKPHEIAAINSDIYPNAIVEQMVDIGNKLHISYNMPNYDTAVFEGSQGVLLDEWYGFHPFTTWSTTTPYHALEMVAESEATELSVLGLTRAYTTRHGNGPFPTYNKTWTDTILDIGNPTNEWQGSFKVGPLDTQLLKYAADSAGHIDNIAISCIDQLKLVSDDYGFNVGVGYSNRNNADNMSSSNHNFIIIAGYKSLKHQEKLTERLSNVIVSYLKLSIDDMYQIVSGIAPIAIKGYGPTHLDRIGTSLTFRQL